MQQTSRIINMSLTAKFWPGILKTGQLIGVPAFLSFVNQVKTTLLSLGLFSLHPIGVISFIYRIMQLHSLFSHTQIVDHGTPLSNDVLPCDSVITANISVMEYDFNLGILYWLSIWDWWYLLWKHGSIYGYIFSLNVISKHEW